ncbi:hypothetical protein JR316_0010795 [Psilocybe cubensis]|uniref:Transmembrane protein n=2 Tax=Psilocybe cubensis TaxID=181762 RepID=A0A8H7XTN7_PSICU|nr:hypothetical protein JR316_0010795 [Psilocybe cubensis]KAH9476879.1 hypothetical protein JR316_0010795 [Psilocybe cubensis]
MPLARMVNSAPLSIIVDDQRTDYIVLSGPQQWTSTTEPEWFNGTSQSPTYALQNKGGFGTLEMKFHGTSVAFFGVTPPVFPDSQILSVSIDGSVPYNTSYADPNPQTYRQWYQSPLLADGPHVVALSHIAGTSLDYAVVTVGPSTPLTNEHIIVDNDDPGVTFNGTWSRSHSMFNSGPQPDGFPYHNTTHQSSTVGSSFTYRFSGQDTRSLPVYLRSSKVLGHSAAVYGIFNWAYVGILSLTFSLDGESLAQSYRVSPDTPQSKNEIGQQQNFLFYSYDFLSPGDHTLTVNVTEAINQTFAFDYITFKPSFSSLSNMPDLSQTSVSGMLKGDKSSTRHSFAIVAVVASTVLLLLLSGLLFAYMKHRKNLKGRYVPVYPFALVQEHRPEVTVIRGLLSQPDLGTASSIGRESSWNEGSSQDNLIDPHNNRQGQLDSAASSHVHSLENLSTPSATTSTALVADRSHIAHRSVISTGGSERDSMYTQSSPPSYDETTREQPPPTPFRRTAQQ